MPNLHLRCSTEEPGPKQDMHNVLKHIAVLKEPGSIVHAALTSKPGSKGAESLANARGKLDTNTADAISGFLSERDIMSLTYSNASAGKTATDARGREAVRQEQRAMHMGALSI